MTRKQKRLTVIGGGLFVLAIAAGLVLFALQQRIAFFRMPSDIQAADVSSGSRFRLGGLVEKGSVSRGPGSRISFAVTDTAKSIAVTYDGILPDLFREEQGVVVEGSFAEGGAFVADSVLAKHDENYMPKDVADGLKAKGVWREEPKP
ncbi:cytochrome c maturation protein CcmE [Phyllobacterium sp. 21LDTY02-6]|jgi:cytochrome c-type biogenesis protein CcmE|uniref:cytochrome c maturation protein CcmE n=1 Tax=unclassified Phyllobacterium TaxID=2638441 RepID=UPI00202294D8|nr:MULTISPECIES: cytochrome c maturation protein CcmE [unclassified Phyllobacterium]MCO4318330.1 cytochrome c maturation protein CcmE [Phyllobacterium sp. 21LDTY02-6]MCX8281251.1 cytochrome c maturation protein CcmE [Phyllobacterium sp. 0TCS1.6C]MCX8296093.1 cytochrome c maturation protein CcmE [Phyllobacterium sp. 0TCS1.6A]